jgi:hypothetical protein
LTRHSIFSITSGSDNPEAIQMLQRFLSKADAERVLHVFQKLTVHDIRRWAVTGGLAVELHHVRLGAQPSLRPLNDLDFITGSFDCIPETLADEFLFRHIHPLDPPGKTMARSQKADASCNVQGGLQRPSGSHPEPSGVARRSRLLKGHAEILLTLQAYSGVPSG